ncbi:hypothetical protein VTK26DRAFT_3903 [Humicola hyalothermophila]
MRLGLATVLLALTSGALSQHVVEFNVSKGLPGVHIGTGPYKARRDTYGQELINSVAGGGYFTQVKIGTPPQTVTMLLDTGSSDAWVLSHEADLCTDKEKQAFYGTTCVDTYNPDDSSTHKTLRTEGFRIVYLDGSSASGEYITDDFTIGNATIEALQMAYVTKAVRGTGILGLGFSISEKAAIKYPNIMDQMANQGLIDCKAYSLYLNDRRSDSGSILFGGIDTDKFIGPLEILPLHRPDGANHTSFEVNFTSITLAYTNGSRLDVPTSILDHPAPAVLDSGTTYSYLPEKMADAIYASVGAIYDPDLRLTVIDCKYLTSEPDLKLTFHFPPSAFITVPVWEMVLDILPPAYPSHPKFSRTCVFGIQSTDIFDGDDSEDEDEDDSVGAGADDDDDDDEDDGKNNDNNNKKSNDKPSNNTNKTKRRQQQQQQQPSSANFTLLGDTFLRSAYVVFDLTHYQVGMAQANLNSSTSTVVELSSSGTSLPRVTGVPTQQTTFTPTPTRRLDVPPDAEPSENAGAAGATVAGLSRGRQSLFGGGGGGGGGGGEALAVVVVTGFWVVLGGIFFSL